MVQRFEINPPGLAQRFALRISYWPWAVFTSSVSLPIRKKASAASGWMPTIADSTYGINSFSSYPDGALT